jgi:RNA polymerase sigma-70 factor, ECF subfamily
MQRGLTLTGKAARPPSTREPTTDEALVRSIAHGEKRAMQVLFARHNVRVYRFIARLLGDSAPAEDLVSEVFLEVWRKAHQFEGRSQVSTWLLGIARYKALTHLRRPTIDQLEEEAAHAIEDPADSPHAVLEKKEKGVLLRKALTQLSPAHSEIIDLIYYHERSMTEVSAILQIPEPTVRTRMFYARKRLAEILKAEGTKHSGGQSGNGAI